MSRCAAAAILLALEAGCREKRSAPPDAGIVTGTDTGTAAATEAGPIAEADALAGTWERRTEPFAGMVLTIRPSDPRATIRQAPPVTEERIAARGGARAKATAELACQRSLWREGEAYLDDIAGEGKSRTRATARVVVRDWGLTPRCEHRDTKATARLTVIGDRLEIVVTRGSSSVTQEWARVP